MQRERKKLAFKLSLSILVVTFWWIIEGMDRLFELNIHQMGLHPKSLVGLLGIITYPFIHGDWDHLISNSLPGMLLFTLLLVQHEKQALKIAGILYLSSGFLLWIIGESGSIHIGASGIIYAFAFFLFFSGIFAREKSSIAISLFVVLWYGGMFWGLFPIESTVSWEGHLSGAICGTLLAIILHRKTIGHHFSKKSEQKVHFFEKNPLPDQ